VAGFHRGSRLRLKVSPGTRWDNRCTTRNRRVHGGARRVQRVAITQETRIKTPTVLLRPRSLVATAFLRRSEGSLYGLRAVWSAIGYWARATASGKQVPYVVDHSSPRTSSLQRHAEQGGRGFPDAIQYAPSCTGLTEMSGCRTIRRPNEDRSPKERSTGYSCSDCPIRRFRPSSWLRAAVVSPFAARATTARTACGSGGSTPAASTRPRKQHTWPGAILPATPDDTGAYLKWGRSPGRHRRNSLQPRLGGYAG